MFGRCTVNVRLDVNICVDPNSTVSQASALAFTLRESLEDSLYIDQANVYLDLNAETEEAASLLAQYQ